MEERHKLCFSILKFWFSIPQTQAAILYDEESGRKMEVYTDLPGVQLYCGGWLAKEGNPGKGSSKVINSAFQF